MFEAQVHNISESVRYLGPRDNHQEMAHWDSNGHVTDDVTWPRKVYLMTPMYLGQGHIISTIVIPYGHVYGYTWRHQSHDHSNPNRSFPIGGPLDPSLYLQPFSSYLALSILRSRPWPFRSLTWRHRWRDHFDSQVVISYRCSIGTNSHQVRTVSPTIVDIMCPKYIGVMR